MINNIKKIIYDTTFKIIILNNKINIINYIDIPVFEEKRILIKTKEKTIEIKGNNLIINKLYNNEILIEGKIESIEFR